MTTMTLTDVDLRGLGYGGAIARISQEMDASKKLDIFSGSFLLSVAFQIEKEEALDDLMEFRKLPKAERDHKMHKHLCPICGAMAEKMVIADQDIKKMTLDEAALHLCKFCESSPNVNVETIVFLLSVAHEIPQSAARAAITKCFEEGGHLD